MDDLLNTLYRLRRDFQVMGFNDEDMPVLTFKSAEPGRRILLMLNQTAHFEFKADPTNPRPVMDERMEHWMELTVLGFKMRWPAQRMQLPGGVVRF